MGKEVVADFGATINGNEAVEDGEAADFDVAVDEAVGADVDAVADFRGGGDDGCGMDSGNDGRCRMEKLDGSREIEIGIGGAQRRDGNAGLAGRDEDRRGAGGTERGTILAIGEEGEVAGFGVLDSGNAFDFEIRIAFEFAAELCGDFVKFHADSPWRPHCILIFGVEFREKATCAEASGMQTGQFVSIRKSEEGQKIKVIEISNRGVSIRKAVVVMSGE